MVERGVDALTTRDIAEEADAPVASLYQYFSDKEDVLLALALRDMAEMDDQVANDLAELEVLSISSIVRTTMLAFVSVYRRRPAFVEIYLRGRTNQAVHRSGATTTSGSPRTCVRSRSTPVWRARTCPSRSPSSPSRSATGSSSSPTREDVDGDGEMVEEGIALVTAYLERYATPAGLEGVSAREPT